MESKVCSRSQGQPPSPRKRAMIETTRSKRSPVVVAMRLQCKRGMATGQTGGKFRSLRSKQRVGEFQCFTHDLGFVRKNAIDAPDGETQHGHAVVHGPGKN